MRCYRHGVTRSCHGYEPLAGMHEASAASLWCAGTVDARGLTRQSVEHDALGHLRCVRSMRQRPSALSMGAGRGRKHQTDEQSHKLLNFAVVADRNVA